MFHAILSRGYGFGVSDHRFLQEWLYAWPHGRKQVWFERENDSFRFGDHLKGENKVAQSVTRPNGLFLSAAVQNRHEQLEPIFRWFRNIRCHNVPGSLGVEPTQSDMFVEYDENERPSRLRRFRELLTAADVGIVDFKVQSDVPDHRSEPWQRGAHPRVFMQHKSSTPDAWLPLERESHGTQQLFRLAPLIIATLDAGAVLVVDELEASFHPLLALQIVQTFNDPKRNARKAQLVFSTHDTNLLGTMLGDPSLSRDQVWLTEKDQEGASVLYPLSDYKPRKEENLERGYLQGRYGGIPFRRGLVRLRSRRASRGTSRATLR